MYYILIILLDIFLVSLLFLCATALAAFIKALNPSIYSTQAANIAITLWLAASFALQPAIWMKNVHKWKRLLAWLLAVLGGTIIYLLMEFLAVYLLQVHTSFIFLGVVANLAFEVVSPILCIRLMRRFKTHFETESNEDKDNNKQKYGWLWILFGLLSIYFIGMLVVLIDVKSLIDPKSLVDIRSFGDWQKVERIVSSVFVLGIVSGFIFWVSFLFSKYIFKDNIFRGLRDKVTDIKNEALGRQNKAAEAWEKIRDKNNSIDLKKELAAHINKIKKKSESMTMEQKWASLIKGDTQVKVASIVGKPAFVENDDEDSAQEIWVYECGSGGKRSLTFKDGFMVKIEVKF